jgi:hypothetical protein
MRMAGEGGAGRAQKRRVGLQKGGRPGFPSSCLCRQRKGGITGDDMHGHNYSRLSSSLHPRRPRVYRVNEAGTGSGWSSHDMLGCPLRANPRRVIGYPLSFLM